MQCSPTLLFAVQTFCQAKQQVFLYSLYKLQNTLDQYEFTQCKREIQKVLFCPGRRVGWKMKEIKCITHG